MVAPELPPHIDFMNEQIPICGRIELLDRDLPSLPSTLPDLREEAGTFTRSTYFDMHTFEDSLDSLIVRDLQWGDGPIRNSDVGVSRAVSAQDVKSPFAKLHPP